MLFLTRLRLALTELPSSLSLSPQVYTPSNILNQSHVVMMFQSGAGVEVLENEHYMASRVYLPWEFIVSSNTGRVSCLQKCIVA